MLEDDQTNLEGAPDVEVPADKPAAPKRRKPTIDTMTAGVALLVALGAGGLYYMHAQTARSVAVIASTNANAGSVESLLTGGRAGLARLARDIDQTRQTIEGFSRNGSFALASARPMGRDPFEFHSLEPSQAPVQSGNTNQAAREAARALALEGARKLQLQSIMYGSAKRSCLVDGKLYFEGQAVGDFTIVRIATDAVTVQSGEFKFELRLRK